MEQRDNITSLLIKYQALERRRTKQREATAKGNKHE